MRRLSAHCEQRGSVAAKVVFANNPCSFGILTWQHRGFAVVATSYFEGDTDFWEAEGGRSTVYLVTFPQIKNQSGLWSYFACLLQRPHIPETSNCLRRMLNNSNCLVPIAKVTECLSVQCRLLCILWDFLPARNPLSFLTFISKTSLSEKYLLISFLLDEAPQNTIWETNKYNFALWGLLLRVNVSSIGKKYLRTK